MKGFYLLSIIVAGIMVVLIYGCATAISVFPPEVRDVQQYTLHQEKNGIVVALDIYTEKERVERVFGGYLLEDGIVPILIIIKNGTDHSILFSTEKAILENSGKSITTSQSLHTYAAEKFKPSTTQTVVGTAIMFVPLFPVLLVPILASLPVTLPEGGKWVNNQKIVNHMQEISVLDQTIARGQTKHGFIYLLGNKELFKSKTTNLTVILTQPSSGSDTQFNFDLTGFLSKAIE